MAIKRALPGGEFAGRIGPEVLAGTPRHTAGDLNALVGAGRMIDSHVLVGSHAQVGEGVHLPDAAIAGC